MRLRLVVPVLAVLLLSPVTATPASAAHGSLPPGSAAPRGVDDSCPDGQFPEDGFVDVPATNVHETAVECLVWWRVAAGRNSAYYLPAAGVTRDAMASFVARAVGVDLTQPVPDAFTDDNTSVHQQAINHLAQVGVVGGTGDGRYSPTRVVSRGQMARFLANAAAHVLAEPLPATQDFFDDDEGHPFETDINRAAQAGLAGGRSGRSYDPSGLVTRDQMASFLARLLDLFTEGGVRTAPAAETTPRDPGDDVGCGDFLTRAHAQSRYGFYFPHYGDNAQLDPDGDRHACDGPTGCPTQPTGQVPESVAALCLYEAWVIGELRLAEPYASLDAIGFFDFPYPGEPWQWDGCDAAMAEEGGRSCYWYVPDPDPRFHGVLVEMLLDTDEQGHYVRLVETYG